MLGINIMKVSAIIWLSSDGATSYCEECPTDLSSDIILAVTTIIISFSMILGLYEAIRMLTNNNGNRQESEYLSELVSHDNFSMRKEKSLLGMPLKTKQKGEKGGGVQ